MSPQKWMNQREDPNKVAEIQQQGIRYVTPDRKSNADQAKKYFEGDKQKTADAL